VSVPQYAAKPSSIPIRYGQSGRYTQPTRREPLDLAIAAIAMVTAVFWASVAWLVSGWLAAVVAAIVVLVVSIFALGVVRSASGTETPTATHRLPDWRQAA
jgi:Flp pilus assembly protein TadB